MWTSCRRPLQRALIWNTQQFKRHGSSERTVDAVNPVAGNSTGAGAGALGRFARPLGVVGNRSSSESRIESTPPVSNYKKERVPPRPFPREEQRDSGKGSFVDRIFSEFGAGEGSRESQTTLSRESESQLNRQPNSDYVDRRSAFSGKEEYRRQDSSHYRAKEQENVAEGRSRTYNRANVGSGLDRKSRPSAKHEYESRSSTISRVDQWDSPRSSDRHGSDQDGDSKFDRRFRASDDQPHYGYHFKRDGSEIGEFRRLDGPSLSGQNGKDREDRRRSMGTDRTDGRSSRVNERGSSQLERNNRNFGEETEVNYLATEESSPRSGRFPRRQEGEKKWQYAVRKKQTLAGWSRGQVRKTAETFGDDEGLGSEPQGDQWRNKKLDWLCKELPGLKPRGVVTILNEQRAWIKSEDVKYIVEELLKMNQFLRAHRVLKWEMQQPFYEYSFQLNTLVANALGENNKLSRTRDLYDLMIQNRMVPELSTYVLLINCYIEEGTNEALQKGSYLFNQMNQMGGYEPPASLRIKLFKALIQKNQTHIEQADAIFDGIRTTGLVASEEMYNQLLLVHGTRGNHARMELLMKEMRDLGLKIGDDVYSAIIKACVKDGDVLKAEQAFSDLKMVWERPIPSVYAALIQLFGKAGLPDKAYKSFDEIKHSGVSININVYEPIIEVMAMAGKRQQAEKLVKEAEERGLQGMQSCYNALMRMYSEIGAVEDAERVFQELSSKGYPPKVASYNVFLEVYVKHGLIEKAEALFQSMQGEENKIKPYQRTYELMIKAYGEKGMSNKVNAIFRQMAEKQMNVPKGAEAKILEGAVSPKQIQALKNSKLKLSKGQREVLAGVLLAGARVESHDKNRTYELHFELVQEEQVRSILLFHLYQQFSDWSMEGPKEGLVSDPKNPLKTKKVLAFKTVSHGSFRFFAHQYRPDGIAKIPRLIHRWLTPQTLAFWYMYGGHRCPQTGGVILNASAYSTKELTLVVDALKVKTIESAKRESKNELSLIVTGKSASWLWKLMQPHIVPGAEAFLKPEDRKSSIVS